MNTNQATPIVPFVVADTPEERCILKAKHKDPEEKQFLLLIVYIDEDGEPFSSFEIVKGRTAARQFVIDELEEIDIDFSNSTILAEGKPFGCQLPLADFLRHVAKFYDDGFDIDEYLGQPSSYSEELSSEQPVEYANDSVDVEAPATPADMHDDGVDI